MKLNTQELVADLQDRTQKATALVAVFYKLDESRLQYKSNPNSWSVLECIAHLNRYYAFYLPLLTKATVKPNPEKTATFFKTGLLGQFFVKLMEPKKNKIKKMKAVAKMNPNGSLLSIEELNLFNHYQNEFLAVLERCEQVDLNGHQVPTVISKWITISLGDTLRFIVVHNERHLLQAQNCLKSAIKIVG